MMLPFLDDVAPEVLDGVGGNSALATAVIAVLLLAVGVGAFFAVRAVRRARAAGKEE